MSEQKFNPDKEWGMGVSIFISEINDKFTNIPKLKGANLIFQIGSDPSDISNTLLKMKINSKGKHVEIVCNLEKFLESVQQAKLRR